MKQQNSEVANTAPHLATRTGGERKKVHTELLPTRAHCTARIMSSTYSNPETSILCHLFPLITSLLLKMTMQNTNLVTLRFLVVENKHDIRRRVSKQYKRQ